MKEKAHLILVGLLLFLSPKVSIRLARKWFASDVSLSSFEENAKATFSRFWKAFIIFGIMIAVLLIVVVTVINENLVISQNLLFRMVSIDFMLTASLTSLPWSEFTWDGVSLNERLGRGLTGFCQVAGTILLILSLTI